jgi:malate dehydrogenase (oxaloacetate-decarboxylating)(NADP+)
MRIAELAQAEQSEVVAAAYAGATLSFGPEYLIPKPFDPRLMMKIAPAVAQAAMERAWRCGRSPTGRLPREAAELRLRLGQIMKPIFALAKQATHKRVAYAEGEEERVLRAVQVVVDEGLARPTLIGRPAVIAAAHREVRPALREGSDYDVVNVEQDERYRDFWQTYHRMTERKGVTVQMAKIEMRRRLTLIGAMLLHKGEVDGMLCGTWGTTANHLHYIDQVIGKRIGGSPRTAQDVRVYACMNGLMLPGRQVFLVDTHVNADPTAEELCEITVMAAEEMLRFGIQPKAALLSHSNFGTASQPSALKMRRTLELLRQQAPWLEVDGEMHGDVALDAAARRALMPRSTWRRRQPAGAAEHRRGQHRLQPAEDRRRRRHRHRPGAAGRGKPVHILTPSATVRRIVNMTALTVADANAAR